MVAAAGQATPSPIALPYRCSPPFSLDWSCAYISVRFGALNRIGTVYSPEVLSLRASHLIQRLGYEGHDNDNAWGFSWDPSSLWYLNVNQKPFPGWDAVLLERPSSLFVEGVLSAVPITTHPSDWYFNSTVFMLGSIVALATWAFLHRHRRPATVETGLVRSTASLTASRTDFPLGRRHTSARDPCLRSAPSGRQPISRR